MVTICSVNGRIISPDGAAIPPGDRGFTLGDGVFETIRVRQGEPLQFARHLRRLHHGASALALEAPDTSSLLREIGRLLHISRLEEAVVRISVSRGVGRRGLAPHPGPPTVVVSVQPFEPYPARCYILGMQVSICAVRRNEQSPLCSFKSLSQADMVIARCEAQRYGADMALLLNTQGVLASADCANLFVLQGKRLLTPSLAAGALPGLTRAALLALAGGIGLTAVETDLACDELWAADEALLTNVLLEVAPLTAVDGRPIGDGRPGLWAERLRRAYRLALGLDLR